MRAKNLTGTSGRMCACGSWTKHWEKHSGATYRPKACAVKGCGGAPEVGAHVQLLGSEDRRHYIVLTCRGCNNQFGEELDLHGYVKGAWANVGETCMPRVVR